GHQLVPIGDYVIDWVASDGSYRLWRFDPGSSDPLGRDTVQEGKWDTIGDQHTLVGVQPTIPLGAASSTPATLDYMRSKIKKIVFYMLENRSFDHVCGWLYEHDVPSHLIGSTEQYDGANSKYFNVDAGGKKIYVSKYEGENLDCPTEGAKHDHGDVMNQLFEPFDKTYAKKNSPPMTGFVLDNATGQTMETYTPERLSVLNGLAKAYAISDAWFCSLPGPTDLNRAFSLTGSSFGFTTSFESGRSYQYWPNTPHRPSIWKVLWDNGFDDWTIYYPDDWEGFCYTYHLFLKGQIPTVDANRSPHLKTMEDHFYQEASNGSLPRFSFIEPAWIGGDPKGGDRPPNSYHPPMDLVPGEITLNNVYNALFGEGTTLQQREETLLVITFDEHGGQYDHVSPPYGARPYANDKDSKSGFEFDLFGVRVPTILVSPWIEEKTVFRSQTPVQYDSTSILATVLSWYGVPKERWGLGERTAHAPTFESVFTRETARTDQPAFTPPLAEKTLGASDIPLNDLHRLFVPRILWHLAGGKIDDDQLDEAAQDIQNRANNVEELHNLLAAFQESIAQMN
ncbi:MAG: hypothetical protein IH872_09920, partial [Chloroflexi bacterium]|nr:hypothetical protein [Chloroflexota bacterium]